MKNDVKKYENVFHAIASLKKQNIEITTRNRVILTYEFEKARLRCELPLSETYIKSCLS